MASHFYLPTHRLWRVTVRLLPHLHTGHLLVTAQSAQLARERLTYLHQQNLLDRKYWRQPRDRPCLVYINPRLVFEGSALEYWSECSNLQEAIDRGHIEELPSQGVAITNVDESH
jgi:hypothetical protein